jgi:hypothetical protein
MRYILTLFVLLGIASCQEKQQYRCECSSKRGQIVYFYDSEYDKPEDGVPGCNAAEDSIIAANPNAGANCFIYPKED